MRLDQHAYISNLIAKHSMENCSPTLTPSVVGQTLSKDQSPASNDNAHDYEDYTCGLRYLECLGGILYTTQTCPDIQYATGVCTQFGANPGKLHLTALKRILHHLKGTADYGLVLGGQTDSEDLVGWMDSDWAQD